jgi:hypothetical protein
MSDKYPDSDEGVAQKPLPRRNRKPYEEYTPEDVKLRLDEARKDLTDPKSPLAKLLSDPDDLEKHLEKVERLLISSIERAFIKVGKKFDRKRFVKRVSTLQGKSRPAVSSDTTPVEQAAPIEQKVIPEKKEQPKAGAGKTMPVPDKTSKPKEIEKVVVVDKKGDLSSVKVGNLVSPQKPAGEEEDEEEDDTKSRSLLGRVGRDMFSTAFPTLTKLTKTIKGEKKGETTKDKMKRLGGDVFRTAFPTLAKVIEYVNDEKKKKSTEGVREATRSRKALDKTMSMAEALNALSTEQRKSVDLLEDLLEAVKGLRGRQRVGMLGRFGRMLGRAAGLARSAAPVLAGAAVVGAAGYALTQNQARRESETQPPSPSPVGNTRVGSNDAPPPIVQLSEEQREIYNQLESAISSGVLTREQADRITIGLHYGTMTAEQAREEIVNNIAIPQANNVPAAGTSAVPALPAPPAQVPAVPGPVATEVPAPPAPPIQVPAVPAPPALPIQVPAVPAPPIQVPAVPGLVPPAVQVPAVPAPPIQVPAVPAPPIQVPAVPGLVPPAVQAPAAPATPVAPTQVPAIPSSVATEAPASATPVQVPAVIPSNNADLVTRAAAGGMLKDSDLVSDSKSSVTTITAESLIKNAPTPDRTSPSGMGLITKTKAVTFKGGEIEFVGSAPNQVAKSNVSTMPSIVPFGAAGSGTVTPAPAPSGSDSSEGSGSQQLAKEQEGAAETGSLTFASGVDPRIKKDIAQKVQQIESAFGKKLTITSGFRDPHRNAAAGGARNSSHTRASAVDIRFQGNEEETNKLVEAASAAGIGGIGVYRPGWVHLDVESRRVWGPDFSARSVPEWSKDTLQAHMTGQIQKSPAGETAAEPVATSPASPSMAEAPSSGGSEGGGQMETGGGSSPVPAPKASGNEMGAAVAGASQENAMAERTPVPPTVTAVQSESPGQATPGAAVSGGPAQNPNDPGNVEPDDAAERYAKLFNMAA